MLVFTRDRRAWLAASVLALAGVGVAACFDGSSYCENYTLNVAYPVPGLANAACSVTVSGPNASAVYSFASYSTVSDMGPCDGAPDASTPDCPYWALCTILSGPPEIACERQWAPGSEILSVWGDERLFTYLGATTAQVSVECGGAVLSQNVSYPEQCVHGE